MAFESWGRYPKAHQEEVFVTWRHKAGSTLVNSMSGPLLPAGQGRSYGDCCLNDGGAVIHNRLLDRIISFDGVRGVLKCESGVTLQTILSFAVPRGWFLSVLPGTKLISVGGAIANDVHGKNHHCKGTFGQYLLEFELVRSDGSVLHCTPQASANFFSATVGGLGLTGFITWAAIQLKKIESPLVDSETVKFRNLDEFFHISSESASFEYSVAWLDCLATGSGFGRGLFFRGNHSQGEVCSSRRESPRLRVPFDLPRVCAGYPVMRIFNTSYYHSRRKRIGQRMIHYDPFFFPLDSIHSWNRIYGKHGFFQFQCVVPKEALRELLEQVVESGAGSFLAVLKEFGNLLSPGMLSFPRPGFTLSLDFPNRGEKTLQRLTSLDEFVRAAGGAIYPAKDATMAPESFRQYYPRWEEFSSYIDPRFSSSFWRRVTCQQTNHAS